MRAAALTPRKREMTVAQTLSAYGAALTSVALPAAVIHHAKRAVLDWHAAAIAGPAEPPARILERALADDLERGASRLVLGRAATPRAAALINGTAAHTLEVDDIYRHAISHPGAPTIAAALAQAQAIGASGLAFLRAVVAGYEISTRIGSSLGRAHYRFWPSTGTVGSFGAAAAAATLLQLDSARYTHALCTCATMASGLQQAFRTDSMSKPLHAGHAAQVGLLAAAAAAAGFTGAPDVIDGPAGLGRAMRHPVSTARRFAKQPCADRPPEGAHTAAEGEGTPVSEDPDWHASMATLGREFHITDMTFKNHACCGHAFAPIDGAQALQAQMRISADDIHRIHIGTYAAALDVAGNPDPKTAPEARFSVPFAGAPAFLYPHHPPPAFTSALTQRRWMWPAPPIRRPRPRRVSACRLRWPRPCCTAACGRRRSARSACSMRASGPCWRASNCASTRNWTPPSRASARRACGSWRGTRARGNGCKPRAKAIPMRRCPTAR